MHVTSLDVCVTRRKKLYHNAAPVAQINANSEGNIHFHLSAHSMKEVTRCIFLHNIHHNTITVLLPVTTVDTAVGVSGPEKQTAYR